MKQLLPYVMLTALAASAPAFSADGVATLRAQSGTVQSSRGGDFVAVQPGGAFRTGDRLMVGENSSATLVYDNKCQMTFSNPGIYTINQVCHPGTPMATDWAGLWTIAGGVAVGAAILHQGTNDNGPPAASR